MKDQSIVLDSTMHARLLERARKCEIVLHSGAGRLHGQDAVLQLRVKDPEAMLTLPEFMREPLPLDIELVSSEHIQYFLVSKTKGCSVSW